MIAQAYDNPIPGYATPTTSNLRLWDAVPVHEFDLSAFNAGDYDRVSQGKGGDEGSKSERREGGRRGYVQGVPCLHAKKWSQGRVVD